MSVVDVNRRLIQFCTRHPSSRSVVMDRRDSNEHSAHRTPASAGERVNCEAPSRCSVLFTEPQPTTILAKSMRGSATRIVTTIVLGIAAVWCARGLFSGTHDLVQSPTMPGQAAADRPWNDVTAAGNGAEFLPVFVETEAFQVLQHLAIPQRFLSPSDAVPVPLLGDAPFVDQDSGQLPDSANSPGHSIPVLRMFMERDSADASLPVNTETDPEAHDGGFGPAGPFYDGD